MAYYIYVLRCKGDTLYTGITPDLRRRMRQHCGQLAGGAKYTHSHKPEALLRVWETVDHTAAARFECAFKQLTRIQRTAAPDTGAVGCVSFPGCRTSGICAH